MTQQQNTRDLKRLKIKQKYYWNEMVENIKKYVQEYIKCQ